MDDIGDGARIRRVTFNEITQRAVKAAFEHPRDIDRNLVDAQQTRRVLDRLVGYQVSPLLWDKVRRGLSAGRVQTVALRLIVDREREIKAFEKKNTGRSTLISPPLSLRHSTLVFSAKATRKSKSRTARMPRRSGLRWKRRIGSSARRKRRAAIRRHAAVYHQQTATGFLTQHLRFHVKANHDNSQP